MERCLLHDKWSRRTEDGRDQKGHVDLRQRKSDTVARHTGVAGAVSPSSETYLLHCFARRTSPSSASRGRAFPLLHFFMKHCICASREHSKQVRSAKTFSARCPAAVVLRPREDKSSVCLRSQPPVRAPIQLRVSSQSPGVSDSLEPLAR